MKVKGERKETKEEAHINNGGGKDISMKAALLLTQFFPTYAEMRELNK